MGQFFFEKEIVHNSLFTIFLIFPSQHYLTWLILNFYEIFLPFRAYFFSFPFFMQ